MLWPACDKLLDRGTINIKLSDVNKKTYIFISLYYVKYALDWWYRDCNISLLFAYFNVLYLVVDTRRYVYTTIQLLHP